MNKLQKIIELCLLGMDHQGNAIMQDKHFSNKQQRNMIKISSNR